MFRGTTTNLGAVWVAVAVTQGMGNLHQIIGEQIIDGLVEEAVRTCGQRDMAAITMDMAEGTMAQVVTSTGVPLMALVISIHASERLWPSTIGGLEDGCTFRRYWRRQGSIFQISPN